MGYYDDYVNQQQVQQNDYGQYYMQGQTPQVGDHNPNAHPILGILEGFALGYILGVILTWIWKFTLGKILLLGALAYVAYVILSVLL